MQRTRGGQTLTGARILIEALHAEGVTDVFGYPGGAVLPIYDEICQQDGFRHILVRHEQAALHAADAYARCTGRTGVAIVTSGPGATNAVTGIATAYADSVPLVVITGQVGTKLIGTDAFQECDTVGITRPCTKHNFLVRDVAELAETLARAFHIARTGRPGPVVVDIPKDVQCEKCVFEYPESVAIPSYRPVVTGNPARVRQALETILSARRPLLYTGGGVVGADASESLNRFADRLGLPVVSTLMGLGGRRASADGFLGMVGMHGTFEANMAMQHCDVLVALGARFDDRVIGDPQDFTARPRTIVQVDVDPSSISKCVRADLPVVGDAGRVLEAWLGMLEDESLSCDAGALDAWHAEIADWRSRECLAYEAHEDYAIKPQAVIERVARAAGSDAYYTTDVGEHQMWAAQYLKLEKPRHWMTSGGLGTMGYGFPAALGACTAHPGSPVVCFTGDGTIQMNIQELATAKQYGLAPKIVLLNNGYLGMVAFWQRSYYGGRCSESVMDVQPDFVRLAEAYGLRGLRARNYEELDRALELMFGEWRDELVFLDVHIEREEPVLPMVAPGLGLTNMTLAGEA